jgi:ribosome-binding factor A
MDERRAMRVSEVVREELSEIIGFETEDPRLLAVEVTDVHVSPDGRNATVRVVVRGDDRERKLSMAALEHATHFFRHELAGRLNLRLVPDLYFQLDRNPDVDSRVEVLLKRAKKTRGRG